MPATEKSSDLETRRPARFSLPQVWIRFLLALVGLILAFTAALFSTVLRQAGNLWGMIVLASVALALAFVIGLTTVPYLARRVSSGRLRNAVDYKVTRLGVIYTAVVILIGIAALNTGNNLLYIIVAVMLAAILISGIASNLILHNLAIDLRLPEYVFAGESARGRASVANRRRWPPSFSITVTPIQSEKSSSRWQWVPASFAFPPWRPPHEQWLTLPDRKLRRIARPATTAALFAGSAYFAYIPGRGQLAADLDISFPRRGRYKAEGLGVSSRFPFAFLIKTRRVPLAREIIVYPSIVAKEDHVQSLPRIAGAFEAFLSGRGSDLYRIRDYTPDDSARYIDWKATAKSGSLKLREFSRENNRELRIIFDNPVPGRLSVDQYEKAVSAAASLAWHFAKHEPDITFLAQDYRGNGDVHAFLAYLACVKARRSESILMGLQPSNHFNLIVTSSPEALISPDLLDCSYMIFIELARAG